MAIQDEREVLNAMRELRSLQPSDESGRRAMQILDRSHRRRPRWLRVVIPSAIAASMLIAIVAFFSWPNSSARAAENLLHAAQVSDSYKGWVHIGAEDRKNLAGIDYSTVDYSHAYRSQSGEARFFDKIHRADFRYDPENNTIYINEISPTELGESFEHAEKRLPVAVSVKGVMQHWRDENPDEKYTVKQSKEGGLDRYDVIFAGDNKHTLWFDSKSQLLVKHSAYGNTNYYRYNDPVVHEIYDLGVPRDAKVVDLRPTGELKALLDRINSRIEQGLGDCTAVMTEAIVSDDGSIQKLGRLHLYGEADGKFAWYGYSVGGLTYDAFQIGPDGVPIAPPEGWPRVKARDVLERLASANAASGFVSNGIKRVRADQSWASETSIYPRIEEEDWTAGEARHYFGLPGAYRFGSYRLSLYNAPTELRLLRDARRPGLIGIHAVAWHTEYALWVDPARDDLPVEYESRRRLSSPGAPDLIESIKYSDPRQLPNGRWYPSRWTNVMTFNRPDVNHVLRRDCHLFVDPSLKLGDEWFGDPMKHMRPATMPARPAPPTTSATRRASASAPAK